MATRAMTAFNKLENWLKSSEMKRKFYQRKTKKGNGEKMVPVTGIIPRIHVNIKF